jgi:hypothetical protein
MPHSTIIILRYTVYHDHCHHLEFTMRKAAPIRFHTSQFRKWLPALLTLATGLSGILIFGSCEQKKSKPQQKQQGNTNPTPESPAPEPTPETPETPETTDGTGPNPPFVTPDSFNPYSTVTPQSGNRINEMMNEVSNLIYGFNTRYQPFIIESYTPSILETEATQCANSDLDQSVFSQTNTGYTVGRTDASRFTNCINSIGNRVTNRFTSEAQWNVGYDCKGQTYELNNVPLTDIRVSKGLCEYGSAATFRYNGSVTAQEFADAGQTQVLRFFKRTVAISDKAGGNCAWTWNGSERVKVFSDCVFLDRVDGSNQTSTRFVMVTFDRVVGQTSNNGGFLYTGGVANVIYNNWRGQITFNGTNRPTWQMRQDNSNTQLTGELSIPNGHGGQPNLLPGDSGTANGSQPAFGSEAFIPAGGTGGNEFRCASSITVSNLVAEGNGVVPLYTFDTGTTTYYTGYVHETPNSEKQAFVARVANNQLVWCRTLTTQASGRSQGAFVGVARGSLYVIFVANQGSFPTVGTAYIPNHPAPGRDIAYIARLSEASGNLLNATWFDFTTNGSGSFSTLLIDDQGAPTDQLRLRAYLANAQPPSCQRTATGEYATGVRLDLSGIASSALACP